MTIREYDPATDAAALRACMAELQDVERAYEPGMPPGEAIVDAYLATTLGRVASTDGRVFVAESPDGAIVGLVSVMAHTTPDEPDEDPRPYAWISELHVRAEHRGGGIGQALMAHAEAWLRTRGAARLKIGVLARNRPARALYERLGFREYHVQLEKDLTAVPARRRRPVTPRRPRAGTRRRSS